MDLTARLISLSVLVTGILLGAHAQAQQACWKWQAENGPLHTQIFSTGDEYAQKAHEYVVAHLVTSLGSCTSTYTTIVWPFATIPGAPTHSNQSVTVSFTIRSDSVCQPGNQQFHNNLVYNYLGRASSQLCPTYYLRDDPPPQSESGETCDKATSLVADPINPANGSVVKTEGDCASSEGGAPTFKRYYDSSNSVASYMGPGWRGSFSRRVVLSTAIATARAYISGDSGQSSQFGTPSSACTDGFAEIQPRRPSWADATANYEDDLCKVIKNNRVIAILPIYTTNGVPLLASATVGYEVVRDDGQVIRYWNQGGTMYGPAGVTLRFQSITNGYLIIDDNDNVETYNSSGVLQSITSRAGVVQTMNYDTSGRLNTVIDSFGHQLTFQYDAQNRMMSVTRQ